MRTYPLLQILADGELHSGQELAEHAGVSRTAIWKQLREIEKESGVAIESVRGRGYRLARSLDLLDVSRITRGIPTSLLERLRIDLLAVTGSTNDYLTEQEMGGADYRVCLAEQQTSGRGRRGRQWVSPFADSLSVSLAFDLDGGGQAIDGLSLVVGIGVVRALEDVGVRDAELKWPNDVWLKGLKLAGILVELRGEAQGGLKVVVGVGINVSLSGAAAETIDQPWISLQEGGVSVAGGRNGLATAVIRRIIEVLDRFRQQGFASFQSEWAALDALQGMPVQVVGKGLSGIGAGVDARGCFRLDLGDRMEVLNAGEVSIRQERP